MCCRRQSCRPIASWVYATARRRQRPQCRCRCGSEYRCTAAAATRAASRRPVRRQVRGAQQPPPRPHVQTVACSSVRSRGEPSPKTVLLEPRRATASARVSHATEAVWGLACLSAGKRGAARPPDPRTVGAGFQSAARFTTWLFSSAAPAPREKGLPLHCFVVWPWH